MKIIIFNVASEVLMMENKEAEIKTVSQDNIYLLNGRVPLSKAIPFGLQHVLAMFVANLAPVLIVCSAALVRGTDTHLTAVEITQLLQCAMFAAGIGTCLQLYPIWKIGSKLPIVMGVSFTFLGSLLMICTNPALGYEGMVGAVILGGIFEGLVGLSAKYWKRFLTPVVSACVVIAIGLSLLSVGMNSWGGGNGVADFGAWYHLAIGTFTLIVCLVSRYCLKGVYKNLNILVGLIVGYVAAAILTCAVVLRLAMAAFLAAYLSARGLRTHIVEQKDAGNILMADFPCAQDAPRRILLSGHMDTVFPADSPLFRYRRRTDEQKRAEGTGF